MGHKETFDHTADLGLRIRASDLGDLFETAAEGLFDVIVANKEDVRSLDHEESCSCGRDDGRLADRMAQRVDFPVRDRTSALR